MSYTNLIEQIDCIALQRPSQSVYLDGERQYTYGELKTKSDCLAHFLQQSCTNESPIVVFGGLQFEMIVCFLAAVKSGRAYIPIDAHTPADRISMIVKVAQPAMILGVEAFDESLANCPVVQRDMLIQYSHHAYEGAENSLKPVQGDENFYIIFTSGTTGVPKGVQISHDNLLSFIQWILRDFGISEGSRFLAQAPFSFDLSVMSLYPALASGGSLVPLAKSVTQDFKKLFSVLPHLPIDVWVSTPSFVDICLMDTHFTQEYLESMKQFLFCGEELTLSTATTLKNRFPKAQIFNTYGPTEATVAISQIEITEEHLNQENRLPIGYVKPDCQVLIMEDGKAVEAEQVGEIIIVGPSVSKGYFHNPEKTEAAFFEYQGRQAYHTGDAGKVSLDGLLSYVGRMDFQVKLHGYRIELEDIEAHLSQVSLVHKASVVPKYKEHKVQNLIAFVVANPHDYEKDFELAKAIKKELSQYVMEYMIPQRFVFVDELPLTSNGKIDRRKLMNEVNQ